MKVTIFNAVSLDGFIAGVDDDVSWIDNSDWALFKKLVNDNKVILMGRKTMTSSGNDFPYDCEKNIVLTQNVSKYTSISKNVYFTNKRLDLLINDLRKEKVLKLLIIGGGEINSLAMNLGLVDEIIVDIHPVVLGFGVKMFSKLKKQIKLETKIIKKGENGLVLVKYKVIKK